jgi:hypothetical protein
VRLAVDRVPMRRGEPATVRVEVAARRAVRLWSVRGRLACVEHSLRRLGAGSWSEHTRDQWTQSFTLSEGGRVGAGETLAGSAAITVPADQPATSGGKFPYVAWEVRVSVNLGVKVGCEQAFAVDVS